MNKCLSAATRISKDIYYGLKGNGFFAKKPAPEPYFLKAVLCEPSPLFRLKTSALENNSEIAKCAIRRMLRHKDWFHRMQAAKALGEIKDRGAVEPLCLVLQKDPSISVRAEAAEALGEIGDYSAMPALRKARHDEFSVKLAAKIAMMKIAPLELGDAPGR